MRGQWLIGANLANAKLDGVDFSGAHLEGANLQKVTATGATFEDASMVSVDLSEASLQEADLRNADLSGAAMFKTDLQTADLSDAVLVGAQMQEAVLTSTVIDRTNFAHANFWRAKLTMLHQATNVVFDFADMSSVGITDSWLPNASFVNARLVGAKMEDLKLQHSNFTGADVSNVRIIDTGLEFCIFKGVTMDGTLDVRFNDADLRGAKIRNSVMTNAAMQRVDARGASFDGSNLRGAVLSFARLDNASFARATLTGALFTRAAVNGADFTDAVGVLSANFRSTRGEPIGLDVTTPQRLVRQPIG